MKDFQLVRDLKFYLSERCTFALAPVGLWWELRVELSFSPSVSSAGDHAVMIMLSSLNSLKVWWDILLSKISITYCQSLDFCSKEECLDLLPDLRDSLLHFGDMYFYVIVV